VSKISGPLLDRIDIHIDVPAVKFKELASDTPAESSAEIRERVVRARRVQLERFTSERIFCNAQMSPRLIRKYCGIDSASKGLLEKSTVNFTYDAAGNVTNDGAHSYTYDSENRIVSVDGGSTASYSYDHQNRRYKKTIGSTVTHYVWQGSKVLAEHNGSTGAVLIDYVYSGGRMIAKVASGSSQYFLSDRLSTRLVLDSGGNVSGRMAHLPFGEDFAESGTQDKHHFTSYERDGESGTDYSVNRQYATPIARFMQGDPYRAGCSRSTPQSANRYSYVENDSVNRSDPLGLAWRLVGCTTYSDGIGRSCTTCWEQNDETDTSRARTTCDSVFDPGRGQDPLLIEGGLLDNSGEPGGVGTGPMTCGECCAWAWDLCRDQFLIELSIIGTPGEAAFVCFQKCRGGVQGFGVCLSNCLLNAQIGKQRRIVRALDHFFECLGGQSRLCGLERENCSCPWM
jgi:RHS repeat-associated protein